MENGVKEINRNSQVTFVEALNNSMFVVTCLVFENFYTSLINLHNDVNLFPHRSVHASAVLREQL